MEKTTEEHFVLVHGACLGAWVWYKVVALLKSKGHKVTALDMAACGIHPKCAEYVHSVTDYSEPLLEFMAALPPDERVILVGHSLGGVCTSLAMEKFPQKISVAVFLTAVMPCPGINMDTVSEKDMELALLLIRPTPGTVQDLEQSLISKENYGSVRRVYLKPEKDNLINEGIEKFRIENFPPDELKIIHDADHMPMFSNPHELCACLLDISKKYD